MSDRNVQTEAFFHDIEDQIFRRLRNEANSPSGREELLRATGTHDTLLIDELGKLGITADGLLALRLFPLVLVAWAEADADANERASVMSHAAALGIAEGTTAWILLDRWLTKRPPGLGVDAWRRFTHQMFLTMSDVARQRLIEVTQKQMTEVAKASGGHLGFGKISAKEKAIIHQVIDSMRQQQQQNHPIPNPGI